MNFIQPLYNFYSILKTECDIMKANNFGGGIVEMKVNCVSIFDDKNAMPNDDMVSAALCDTAFIWNELRAYVGDNYPCITGEWKYYGKTSGWTYKLISEKRNLFFFIPRANCFRVRIVLGEKASVCAGEDNGLPNEIKEAICVATSYAEGRSVDIDVNWCEQLEIIKRLLKIKYDN